MELVNGQFVRCMETLIRLHVYCESVNKVMISKYVLDVNRE